MVRDNKYGAYQHASHAVNEIQQVIMLYEGAIKFIMQAKDAIEQKNHQDVYNLVHKAINIITGLNSCLEFNDKTDETAQALDKFYQDIDMRLLYVICDHNVETCDNIIDDLKLMMNAWKDADSQINQNSPSDENAEDFDSKEKEGTTNLTSDTTEETENNSEEYILSQEEQAKKILEQLQNSEINF